MGLVILIVTVVSTYLIMKMTGELLRHFLPHQKWATLLYKIAGLGLGVAYLYFAGYFVMDQEVNLILAWLAALAPAAVFIAWKIFAHASMLED
jgi:hypothetical protein